jgi:hypothetical protein
MTASQNQPETVIVGGGTPNYKLDAAWATRILRSDVGST